MNTKTYDPGAFYDELFAGVGRPRPGAQLLIDRLTSLSDGELMQRQKAAEIALLQMGITFTVYGEKQGVERIFPFDIIPRIIVAEEWEALERGLKQRIVALNHFIHDIYHDQKILADGIIPRDLVTSSRAFRPQCQGLTPSQGIWCHITGTDLIRDQRGTFMVLEDNLRCPSGVSYVLENRVLLKRTYPNVFADLRIRPVDAYPSHLMDMLTSLAPASQAAPKVVLLTPGMYNSAYFEHSFLAMSMGVELVEGRDMVVMDNTVYARTTKGFEKVDVIYRRIDDDFLDPETFRADSMLGIPGLMKAFAAGRVALANAPGCGIADDKAIYAYVPQIISYYLGETALIPNVPTFICWNPKDCEHVLANLDTLVVKSVNEAGGYGMLIGPHADPEQRLAFADLIRRQPRNFIAQPTISLSRVPTIVGDHLEGRHVDFRPYILYGKNLDILPGGLTRVALRAGSLVVNSSQGGGSKDTWVLDRPLTAQVGEVAC
jgi:uncharacterized circularly permuted ATP-grasp superfamily protein